MESLLPVAAWILFASLKSVSVIPLVLLLRRLFARWLTPQACYGLWFAVIACLAIPLGTQVQINEELPAMRPTAAQVISPSITAPRQQPVIRIADAPGAAASKLSMASTAALAWLTGICCL